MRHLLAVAALAALAALAVPAAAGAALTATEMRVSDNPAFVRVVVEFRGGRVLTGEVVATDPDPFPDGRVRLPLSRRGVQTTAAPVSGEGVSASIRQRSGRIVMRLAGAARRFKYVAYRARRAPQRLVIELWKSRPPRAGAEVRRGRGGCLTLGSFSAGERRLRARGRERNLFEHSLAVVLRRADGRIHADRGVTAAAGRWSSSFRFPATTRRRTGTLEAVAMSAKDGTLDCLVQSRVRFGG